MKGISNATRVSRLAIAAVLLAGFFCALAPQSEAAVPKSGAISVVVGGADDFSQKYESTAESVIVNELLSNGYNIVDQKKRAAMRRDAAARLALQGDMQAIMRLGSKYGVSAVITVTLVVGEPEETVGKFKTGTATVNYIAVATNGNYSKADSASSRPTAGSTAALAAKRSVEAAAKAAADIMVR
ncbi:MAG: hypothetical protein LBQ36_01635 [Synergistaceae bacterium]|nr:hypothetical protein [Synergistaceae bacterium]